MFYIFGLPLANAEPGPQLVEARAAVHRPRLLARSSGFHDVGGAPRHLSHPIPADTPSLPWELECHAHFACLSKAGVCSTDELRRAVEGLPTVAHEEWSYYERWAAAIAQLLREHGHLNPGELEAEIYGVSSNGDSSNGESHTARASAGAPRFLPGDRVTVRSHDPVRVAWRMPHLRTPGYLFGVTGVVERCVGAFAEPSLKAFGVDAPPEQHLYHVRFRQAELWAHAEAPEDTVGAEIYQDWLLEVKSHTAPMLDVCAHVTFPHSFIYVPICITPILMNSIWQM